MKVNRLTDALNAFTTAYVKRKADDSGAGSQGQGQQQDSQKRDPEQERFEVTDERVAQAVESFAQDAKQSGLLASMEGKGPGMRVTLKDGTGAVIRQMSGEEFLRLREVAGEPHSRGKILDQKL